MNIVDMIGGQGGQGFSALGRQFGLDDAQSRAAIEQLAPVVMAGIRRNSQSSEGVAGLLEALASGGHERHLEAGGSDPTADGNAILGHIFGSKDVSRGVAAQAANLSGLDTGVLKQMLPVVAAMVMGALSKNMTGGAMGQGAGGLGSILGAVLGGQASSGGAGGMLGQILGGATGGTPSSGGGLADVLGGLLGGDATSGVQAQSRGPDMGNILGSIFGQGAAPGVRQEATRRANDVLGGMLGSGTASGNAADDLLNSVKRALNRQ
jgi:hypothetical protein